MKRVLMTGNEAVARGVYEAGCHIASAYPGTPSTEIEENIGNYPEIYADWAPNEKVALEVAAGAAMGGARAFASMKHVGLNVAADPLFTVAYTGITGSLVINTSDEPGMHSSQNEQDNRLYALHAKIPLLVPADSQECLDFTREAFSISETYDIPVLLRTTTRICHSKSGVITGERLNKRITPYAKDIKKNLMVPAHAKMKHPELEERLKKLKQYSEVTPLNRIVPSETRDSTAKRIGIVTGGIAYQYARDVFKTSASYLVLGMQFPFPEEKLKKFASSVDELYVIEENEPFIEVFIKALGITCRGKDMLPVCGELSAEIITKAFFPNMIPEQPVLSSYQQIPQRPPALCPGCPHRGVFTILSKYRTHPVSTDIGCYTLGALPPLSSGDFLFCMGSSISSGMGFVKAAEIAHEEGDEARNKRIFAVIGDSTFFHSGITGLINVIYSGTPLITIILDNRITAMTGHQENPGSGRDLHRKSAHEISIHGVVSSLGFTDEQISLINPHNLEEVKVAFRKSLAFAGPSVIIAKAPCALLPEMRKEYEQRTFAVDRELCITCKSCIRTGCPAISITEGKSSIDPNLCAACGVCSQVCPVSAISGPLEVPQ